MPTRAGSTLCAADSWVDVALFRRSKETWLRSFLPLPHGIPSDDTCGRGFAALDPAAFEACSLARVRREVADAGLALDGKTRRRSHDRANGRGPLHLVSAWATEGGLVLGQVAVADHANELEAPPVLLDAVDLAGAVVTMGPAAEPDASPRVEAKPTFSTSSLPKCDCPAERSSNPACLPRGAI